MAIFKRLKWLWPKRFSPEDRQFVKFYLDDPGQFLFFQMSHADQRHALAVARMILNRAGYTDGIDLQMLLSAALLHDVGKVEGDLGLVSRLLIGTVRRTIPSLRHKLADTSSETFQRKKIPYGFYVDLVHPARGAYMAKILGIDASVVDLIRRHHDSPRDGQSAELTWLQLADNRN